jgi:hypothetical protein
MRQAQAEIIFLNVVDLAPIARALKERIGDQAKIVLLSHGLESVDYLHALRAKTGSSAFKGTSKFERLTLSEQLIAESIQRQFIDHVFCLAPFEAEIERWLGAKAVTWLPRLIPSHPLNWSPVAGRLGFVGCIDHPPNKEGLELFAPALSRVGRGKAVLRLVGGPRTVAERIAQRFPCIEYLGPLSNLELEEEARSWNCFVNPLFCYARGCSTKLGIGLGWQIPVIATPAGCRGYTWREGIMPMSETPAGLAELAIKMLDADYRSWAQREVIRIVESAPTLSEVAATAREALLGTRNATA